MSKPPLICVAEGRRKLERKMPNNLRPAFNYYLNKNHTNGNKIVACEVGVQYGLNAVNMLKARDNLDLVGVDDFRDNDGKLGKDIEKIAQDNLAPYGDRMKLIKGDSVEAAKDFPNEYFDFVYIDASHEYQDVLDDMKAWFPKVKQMGMLAGHDSFMLEVKRAICDFTKEYGLRLFAVMALVPQAKYLAPEFEPSDWWISKSSVEWGPWL